MSRKIAVRVIAGLLIAALAGCGGGSGGSSSSSGSSSGSGSPLVFTTTSLPDGFAGQPYAAQLGVTGGIPPYKWTTVGIPPGLTMSSTGQISGTLQNWGGYVSVNVQDSGSPVQRASQQWLLTIYAPLNISTTTLPDGHTNAPYEAVVQSHDVKTWTITSGQLPPGLELGSPLISQVEIKGTPSQTGSYPFTLQATSISNPPQTVSQSFTINIDDNPVILNAQLLDVVHGQPYMDTLSAINGVLPYHWSILSGTLPSGIVLDENTGELSGTTTSNIYGYGTSITFQVTDSSSPAKSGSKALSVWTLERLTAGSLPVFATINQYYFSFLYASGGKQPFTWTLNSGSLPPGVTLNSNGQISGIPIQLGTFNFGIRLQDQTNPPQTVDSSYQIIVRPPNLTTSYSLPNRIPLDVAFSGFVAAQGGTPPYTFQVSSGTLPTGLQLSNSTGEVSGTPTALGYYTFSVEVTDSGSPAQTVTQGNYMTVAPPLGRNDSIQKATPLGSSYVNASISPYADPTDTANPDVDYYKIVLTNGQPANLTVSAKQYNSLNPLDSVLEIVDANGARLHNCNDPSQPDGTYISECLNDDVQLGINQDSGLAIKVPGTSGTTVVYAKVSDWRGDARPDMIYTLSVNGAVDPLVIYGNWPAYFAINRPWLVSPYSTGGSPPVTWAVTAGNLPPGLSMSSSGTVTGAITSIGTYTFTVTATDSSTPPQIASKEYTVTSTEPLRFVSPEVFPDACVGQPYAFTMQLSGGVPPVAVGLDWWDLTWSGSGITFNGVTRQWSGTPRSSGTAHATIRANDNYTNYTSQDVTLNIKNCP